VRTHERFVGGEVLADSVHYGRLPGDGHVSEGTVGHGEVVRVAVRRA
jgi:hypothetical protein